MATNRLYIVKKKNLKVYELILSGVFTYLFNTVFIDEIEKNTDNTIKANTESCHLTNVFYN